MRPGAVIGAAGPDSGLLTVGEAARRAHDYLRERGSATPRLDADLLAARALAVERIDIYTDHERPLTDVERTAFRELLRRRGAGEPMAYILGTRAFRRLQLEVGPGVLVPRPETELLVDWALELADSGARVLDWGTGSGAIALALADEGDALSITGIDVSTTALEYARRNATRLGANIEVLRSDGLSGLDGRVFELVVANPPYIASGEIGALGPELGFEPREALVAGPTGYEVFEQLVPAAARSLTGDGWLVLEIGHDQGDRVREIVAGSGFADVEARTDLAGRTRLVAGRRDR